MTQRGSLKEILYVLRRWSNRGQVTGMEHFADYLKGAQFIHHFDRVERPYRLLKWFADKASHDRYTSISAGLELACLFRTLKTHPKLIHFLYGEYDIHYFPTWARLLKIPVIASFHNPPEELERRIKNSDFLKKMTGAILLGDNQKEYFKKYCPNVPYCVIPHGVNTDFFSPAEDFNKKKQILIVGAHMRNWEIIKQFVTSITQNHPDVRIQFCCVHSILHKELDMNVENKHPVTDEQLKSLYQESSAMLYAPTDCVGSNAVVEALACGVPIISLNVGAVRDYLDPSNAFIHDKQDVEGMVKSALKLIENPELRAQMSLAARKRGLELDWKNIRKQHFDFYKELGFSFDAREINYAS